MNNFDYVRPSSVAAASQALLAPGATALSGGHTLIPTMKQRLAKPSMLVDLGGIAELKGIRREGSTLVIGATTTHAEVASSPEVRQAIPALAKLAGGIGDAQVRHRGTMGGSVANNDPGSGLSRRGAGASARPSSPTSARSRRINTSRACSPRRCSRARSSWPSASRSRSVAGYAKFEQRASRYCLVSVFVAKAKGGMFSSGEVRVAVSGAGNNGVFRVPAMEQALKANYAADALRGVSVPASDLMSDMHGSAEYRAALISAMAQRAVSGA